MIVLRDVSGGWCILIAAQRASGADGEVREGGKTRPNNVRSFVRNEKGGAYYFSRTYERLL